MTTDGNPMRRISAGLFTSLDGVIDADGDWQYPYFDAELMRRIQSGGDRIETALIGRTSFEGYRGLRADHPDSPFLPFLERVERHVISRTIDDPRWPGTHVIAGDVIGRVRALKHGAGGGIGVLGSPSIIRLLLAAGLLDELGIIVLPIVVGEGPRLFPEGAPLPRATVELTEATQLASGAVALTYRPAARPPS